MLGIAEIKIEETVNDLAPQCVITFAPVEGNEDSIITIDAALQSVIQSTIRPVNQILTINIFVQGVGNVSFTGIVTHADDFSDPDQYYYSMTIVELPANQPHKRQITTVVSSPDPYSGVVLPVSAIIKNGAQSVMVDWENGEFPDYSYIGTADVAAQTFRDLVEEFLKSYNSFDHRKYRFCCSHGHVYTVQKYDFLNLTSPYTIQNITGSRRTFEQYSSNVMVGTSQILATGGENYADNIDPLADAVKLAARQHTNEGTVQETYSISSNDTSYSVDDTEEALFNRWVETTTVTSNDIILTRLGGSSADIVILPTLTENVEQLLSGVIDNIEIKETRTLSVVEEEFDTIVGKKKRTATTYQFASMLFDGGIHGSGAGMPSAAVCTLGKLPFYEKQKTVATGDESVTTIYTPDGDEIPINMTRRKYKYNSVGTVIATVETQYACIRDQWYLKDTKITNSDPATVENATIAFYKTLRSATPDGPPQHDTKDPFGTFQLLDGVPVKPARFQTVSNCVVSGETIISPYGSYGVNLWGAMYDGLTAVTDLAITQRDLEKGNAITVYTAVSSVLDLNVYIGLSATDSTSSGIVVGYSHSLTANEATTTTNLKRVETQ